MWIAKNKDTGKEYPKIFESIYDCQNYINTELKEDLVKAKEEFVINYMRNNNGNLPFWFSNRILCWNTQQNRFCDGFDF